MDFRPFRYVYQRDAVGSHAACGEGADGRWSCISPSLQAILVLAMILISSTRLRRLLHEMILQDPLGFSRNVGGCAEDTSGACEGYCRICRNMSWQLLTLTPCW